MVDNYLTYFEVEELNAVAKLVEGARPLLLDALKKKTSVHCITQLGGLAKGWRRVPGLFLTHNPTCNGVFL